MKKEDLFTDEFLKQFTTGEELTGFLKQLHLFSALQHPRNFSQ